MITLPGHLPGLLRRGAPVRDLEPHHLDGDLPGVVCSVHGAFALTCWPLPPGGDQTGYAPFSETSALASLVLDLSDPAGVDIAVRWVAEQVQIRPGLTAPTWGREAKILRRNVNGWSIESGPWIAYFHDSDSVSAALSTHHAGVPLRYFAVPGISQIEKPLDALHRVCLFLSARAA